MDSVTDDPKPRQWLRAQWLEQDAKEAKSAASEIDLPLPVLVKLAEQGLDVAALRAELKHIPAQDLLKAVPQPTENQQPDTPLE